MSAKRRQNVLLLTMIKRSCFLQILLLWFLCCIGIMCGCLFSLQKYNYAIRVNCQNILSSFSHSHSNGPIMIYLFKSFHARHMWLPKTQLCAGSRGRKSKYTYLFCSHLKPCITICIQTKYAKQVSCKCEGYKFCSRMNM